jgi:hypothetical protein
LALKRLNTWRLRVFIVLNPFILLAFSFLYLLRWTSNDLFAFFLLQVLVLLFFRYLTYLLSLLIPLVSLIFIFIILRLGIYNYLSVDLSSLSIRLFIVKGTTCPVDIILFLVHIIMRSFFFLLSATLPCSLSPGLVSKVPKSIILIFFVLFLTPRIVYYFLFFLILITKGVCPHFLYL